MIESIVAGIIAMAVATIGLLQTRSRIELGNFAQNVKEMRKEVESCHRERRLLQSKVDKLLRELELSKFESRIKQLEERLGEERPPSDAGEAPSPPPPSEN